MQMRANQIERAAIEREQGGFCERPAEPRRGKAERRRRRHGHHFRRWHLARELRPNPVVEGVAGGEHADALWALAQHFRHCAPERARPRPGASVNKRGSQREMALPPKYDLGALDQSPGGGR